MLDQVDQIRLNFSPGSLLLLNIFLALIMFGIALDLKWSDFRNTFNMPKSVVTGLVSQFLVLPLITFLLVLIIRPLPSIALGMFMVAACPGGNISNFMTHLSRGNTALSVTLTAISTMLAIIFTPINFGFYGNLYEPTSVILKQVSLDPFNLAQTILLILGLPLLLGMLFNNRFPILAMKLSRHFKVFSIIVFIGFVVVAFLNNVEVFREYFQLVIWLVFVHNLVALSTGYSLASLMRLPFPDKKSLTIETGIQNSGLGLILIFNFFDGLGGMAIVAAWWGIWHIFSGLVIATFWSRQSAKVLENA